MSLFAPPVRAAGAGQAPPRRRRARQRPRTVRRGPRLLAGGRGAEGHGEGRSLGAKGWGAGAKFSTDSVLFCSCLHPVRAPQIRARVNRLSAASDAHEPTALFSHCEQGHPAAAFLLAEWHAAGTGVVRVPTCRPLQRASSNSCDARFHGAFRSCWCAGAFLASNAGKPAIAFPSSPLPLRRRRTRRSQPCGTAVRQRRATRRQCWRCRGTSRAGASRPAMRSKRCSGSSPLQRRVWGRSHAHASTMSPGQASALVTPALNFIPLIANRRAQNLLIY